MKIIIAGVLLITSTIMMIEFIAPIPAGFVWCVSAAYLVYKGVDNLVNKNK